MTEPPPSAPWVSPDVAVDVPDHAVISAAAEIDPGRGAPPVDEPPVLLRPMTLSDLLDGAFAVIKRRPGPVLGAAALVVVPFQVLVVFLQRDSFADENGMFFGATPLGVIDALGASSGSEMAAKLAIVFVGMIIPLLLGALVTTFVTGWYAGAEVTAGQALRAMASRSWAIFVVWIVLSPITAVCLAMGVLPVLVPLTFFLVTIPALVAERLGPFAAIARSAHLMSKRFWWGVLLVLLSAIVALVLQLTVPVLPQLVALLLPDPLRWIAIAATTAAVAVLVQTAVVAATVLFYVDARIRTEGLDIELRMPDAFEPAA